LLTIPSIAVVVAILLALGALARARATAKRLERLTESYWELRYESGQLKARVSRLEVAAGLRDADPAAEAPPAPVKTTFVPLSSLKK
jgi:hypothetical protein